MPKFSKHELKRPVFLSLTLAFLMGVGFYNAGDQAIHHPQVVSATIRSKDNRVLADSHKIKGAPAFHVETVTYPIEDSSGNHLGQVILELDAKTPASVTALKSSMRNKSILVSLLAFLLGLIMTKPRTPQSNSQLLDALKKVEQGHLDTRLPEAGPPGQREIAQAFNSLAEGLIERDRMRHSLGRIMDPKIADALIKEDPKLGGKRRKATILFCDIRNYTTICEQLSVNELEEFHNEYWKGTVEIIMEQDGTIDKFHGDGVCVVFGAPNLHEDDPLRAIRTAWRLVANVAALNERRTAKRRMPIQIGIGIHMGEVIAGHIGSERRMDYTVVGDVVNVAARIEELNKKFGTQILISDTVYEKVEDYVSVKTLTLAHLRGHQRPILVHALKEFHDRIDSRKAA